MARRTVNVKEIRVDIKAGMDNTALMQKYQLKTPKRSSENKEDK